MMAERFTMAPVESMQIEARRLVSRVVRKCQAREDVGVITI